MCLKLDCSINDRALERLESNDTVDGVDGIRRTDGCVDGRVMVSMILTDEFLLDFAGRLDLDDLGRLRDLGRNSTEGGGTTEGNGSTVGGVFTGGDESVTTIIISRP